MIKNRISGATLVLLLATGMRAQAQVVNITIDGSDAIWLAGRTDVTIPPTNQDWADSDANTDDGLERHPTPTPEEILETLPSSLPVTGGDIVRVGDPAEGGISFLNGFGSPFLGPEGGGLPGTANMTALGGISGYLGTGGALVGVFLDDNIPLAPAPAALDFSESDIGVNFAALMPGLGQVFYIGDGQTDMGVLHQFTAPVGATRVFFGVTDSFGFGEVPGAYDDNDGAYTAVVGINANPDPDSDGDGVTDLNDNCIALANSDQLDTDGDDIGNLCDADVALPNDCIVNVVDLGVYRANFFVNGALDTDNNGDGITNVIDLGILRAAFFAAPGPSADGCN